MPISRINTNSIANNTIQGVDLLDASITAAKIISVANTQITGNIVSSQITSVGGSQITANTIANSAIQTGAVENYMNAAGLGFGMRNRIINGAMVIDQRNAGASVTPTTDNTYTLDRWTAKLSQSSKYSVQQSSTAPTGFKNSLLITSLSAYTVGASESFFTKQVIEGFNVADLGWGAAGASTVTLSFWVRSSLTGTFGGSFWNSAADRSYPFSYTISVANTFEYKTVTIAGDTSGTWLTTNGGGINVGFAFGVGASLSTTAGAWAAGFYPSATGAVSVVGTSGATFYITGVQLEKGSTATSFDYRPYGTELALCQRYFEKSYDIGTVPSTATQTGIIWSSQMQALTTSYIGMSYTWKVQKRTAPTVTAYDKAGTSGTVTRWTLGAGETDGSNYSLSGVSDSTWLFYSSGSSNSAGIKIHFAATAEL
jgi:hypothetical protein